MANRPETSEIVPAEARIVHSEKTEITVTPSQSAGALYKPIHVTRAVKVYPIEEHELDNIADLSNDSTLWTTISGVMAWMILERVWDWCVDSTNQKPSAQSIGLVIVAAMIGVFGIIKSHLSKKKVKTRLQKILEESSMNG